ncbi:MAG: hypothetical protein ACYC3X_29780 [Pirellulaceae bacterium]
MFKIADFEVIRHGIDHSDYFQGCGTAFTRFSEVATGIGNDEREALDNCLEFIAQSHRLEPGAIDRLTDEILTCETFDDEYTVDDYLRGEGFDPQEDEDLPYFFLSIRYNLENVDYDTDLTAYRYMGDINLTCGGMFVNLENWGYGYADVVEVTDLASACGCVGQLLLVEHKTVLTERWSKQGHGEIVSYWDNWKSALSCCGPTPRDLLTLDLEGKRWALVSALSGYGRYDQDDSWDGYCSPACMVVALGTREETPDDQDGWRVDHRVYSEAEFIDYVLRVHVRPQGFVVEVSTHE